MATVDKLNELSELQSQRDILMLEKRRLLDEAVPAEVTARLAEIEAEFAGKEQTVSENIALIETAIREEVLRGGETVKGTQIMAVYVKGRVTWDGKKLDGMM